MKSIAQWKNFQMWNSNVPPKPYNAMVQNMNFRQHQY